MRLSIALAFIAVVATVYAASDNKYAKTAYDWDELEKKIEDALAGHKDCGKECYKSVIANDLAPWKDGITDAQWAAAKSRVKSVYQIIDGKLYKTGTCMFYLRCNGIEHFLLGLLGDAKGRQSLSKNKKYPMLPNMEFALNERDYPHSSIHNRDTPPTFSFSKSGKERDIMYPAWTFWQAGPAISVEPQGMGRWDLKREKMIKAGAQTPWRKKKPVAFFRGSRTSDQRDPLVLMSREYPDLIEASYTKNQAWKSPKDTLGADPAKELLLEEHCPYKYLYNFRGVAASFRLKHLFLCGSLVFHVGNDWLEFFYPELKPWVHYIPVKEDLSDAWDLMAFAREHDDLMKKIADNGKKFIKDHLKQDDIYDYWYNLLTEYAKLVTWDVKKDPSAVLVKHP